jgi:hypothetical protein
MAMRLGEVCEYTNIIYQRWVNRVDNDLVAGCEYFSLVLMNVHSFCRANKLYLTYYKKQTEESVK